MKIKKGDSVIVIAGKDRGKTGKVTRAIPDTEKVVVDGLNLRKKHRKATSKGQKGQIIEINMPMHVSNVSLVDPKTNKPTRISYQIGEGKEGKKVRVAKKSKTVLD